MVRGSLELIEFQPREIDLAAVEANRAQDTEDLWSRLRRENRTLTSCAAALIVAALHTALIAPALWAGGGAQRRQEQRYRGETALQWVVLDDSSRTASVTPAPLISPRLVAIAMSEVFPTLPSVTPPALPSKDHSAQSGEHASLGALYGRYVGQIHARIDRAWRRPRTAIGAPLFQCQVQIDQDELGRVGDVTLVQCNGDVRWRLSLVRAIEAASPLPAPPNPAVFARHVLLEFRAMAYSPGAPAGLYEAAASLAAVARQQESAQQSQNAFQALRQAATAPYSHRAMELRIEGSRVEVKPDRQ